MKKKNLLASVAMLAIMLFVTISCAIPKNSIAVDFVGDKQQLSFADGQLNNIEQKDGRFFGTNDDPNVVFHVSGKNIKSLAAQIKTDTPDAGIRLYYASQSKEFSEEKFVSPKCVSGSTYYFSLPDEDIESVRLDFNQAFTVGNIEYNNQPFSLSTFKDISTLRMSVAVIIPIVIVLALLLFGVTSKIADKAMAAGKKLFAFIKENPRKLVLGVIGYIGIVAVSAVGEMIYFRLFEKTPNTLGMKFDFFRFLMIFGVLATIFTFFLMRKIAGKKPEYLFLTVILIAGTIFTMALPKTTNVSWDDHIHYGWVATAPIVTDGSLTEADGNMMSILVDKAGLYNYQQAEEHAQRMNELHDKGVTDTKKASVSQVYERLGHIVPGIAMQIGNALNLSYVTQFDMARMASLLVYAIVMFFAIKKLSSGKMILIVLGLMPTFVFLACNFSYDYWITAFLTLGFSYFLYELQNPDKLVRAKDMAIMMGAFVLGCGPKSLYFLFLFLPLFFKKSKIKNKKKFTLICILSIVFTLSMFALYSFKNIAAGGDIRGGADTSTTGQIMYILSNPIEYSKTLLTFLKDFWNPQEWANFPQLFTNAAYLPEFGNSTILMMLLAMVTITDKNEHDIHTDNLKTKGGMLFLAFATSVLIVTALYISFNAVGSTKIEGCQLRYLFPLLFPIFAVIGTPKIKNEMNKATYNYIVIGVSVAILFYDFWMSCVRFYY